MSNVTSLEKLRRETSAIALENEANYLMCSVQKEDADYFLTARMAKRLKERAQKMRDGLLPMFLICPGCGLQLTEELKGGYLCFCRHCVNAFPQAPDANGFILVGKYPDFQWKPVTHNAVAYVQNGGKVAL